MSRDGVLIYANDASREIVDSLGLVVGELLPDDVRERLLASLSSGERQPVACPAGELFFVLLPVLIPEFDFVNIYGTDVTAAREVERLLLNILPPPIADRLRANEQVIADRFEDATLLIADIAGFTEMSSQLSADDLVLLLDQVFRRMDALVERHGLEKVKTIGDAYMVIGGVPLVTTDHVERVSDMALDMVDALDDLQTELLRPVACRIGIHCGPVVAGVIGAKRTIYDVWGDTVNVASRMESLGIPGRIQVTPAIHDRLRGRYRFEERGTIAVKGKGTMATYFLVGRDGPATVDLA
jgi:class 3 adenylate cyclase